MKDLNTVNILVSTPEDYANDPRIEWCVGNLYGLEDDPIYEIDKDNKLIIKCKTLIINSDIEIPIKIDKVIGNVTTDNIINNNVGYLTSLKNFPIEITGFLNISNNPNLISFEGCPEYIGGTFWCSNCGFSNLQYLSKYIGGGFNALYNKISDISEGLNSTINGSIDLYGNPIETDYKNLSLYNIFKSHRCQTYAYRSLLFKHL